MNLAVGSMIQARARRAPEAVAIVASGREPLSYLDLARQIDQVRESLNEFGIGRGDRVAIVIDNGPEMATAFLGVAGAATAAPLNPTYTAAEFEFYLLDLRIGALIVEAGRDTPARPVAEQLGMTVIELASRKEGPAGAFEIRGGRPGPAKRPGAAEAAEIALVLHTSGTTSRPKIVCLSHRNLLTSARNFADWYALEPCDRTLAIMPFFHIQGVVGAVLAPLASGGSIVCARRFDPDSFFALLNEFGPTWYTAGPTFHQAIVAGASRYGDVIRRNPLRFIRSSSAPLAPQTMSELERVFGAPVLEGYGLTESSLHSASNPLPPLPRKPGCVGLPAGIEIAVMDEAGSVLAPGKTGEVVLRGPTLTAGYEANPEANAAAFVGDWFRTGDQGCFDADGYLTLTGRLKELINRGGEKIAPVEIDQVLLDHPEVEHAVAFSIPHPTLGEQVGAAVVLRAGADVDESEIRTFAAKRLAPFKVPRRVVFVDAIPKSTVGKSQRLGLAEKLGISGAAQMPRAVRNGALGAAARSPSPLEAALVEIWRSALRRDTVGVDDDFFFLGGDSLQATQVIFEVQQLFGVELAPEVMFGEASTIRGMAAATERKQSEGAPQTTLEIPTTRRDGALPASLSQRSFWVLSHVFRDTPAFNVACGFRLRGRLDVGALERALGEIVRRHEALRTVLATQEGCLVQVIAVAQSVRLSPLEVTGSTTVEREAAAAAMARREVQRPFDLAGGPLVRFALLQLADEDHVLILSLQHAIVDGWSLEILFRDLTALYPPFATGREPKLPELRVQFADFANWQWRQCDTGRYKADLDYWRGKLANLPPKLLLPCDRPRPKMPNWRGRRATMVLPAELATAIREFGRKRRATLFMILLSAFKAMAYAYTSQNDVLIGVPVANRAGRDLQDVIGCFVNTLPIRTNLMGDPTLDDLLHRVRRTAIEAFAHQEVPFEKLAAELRLLRQPSLEPFFPVLFQLRNYIGSRTTAASGLRIEPFDFDPGISPFELGVEFEDSSDGLVCSFVYKTGLFDDARIDAMMLHYQDILEVTVSAPDTKLSRL